MKKKTQRSKNTLQQKNYENMCKAQAKNTAKAYIKALQNPLPKCEWDLNEQINLMLSASQWGAIYGQVMQKDFFL